MEPQGPNDAADGQVSPDASSAMAGDAIGRICPYCRFPLKHGAQVATCPACNLPHHADCWCENGGCTTYGCQGTVGVVGGLPSVLSPADLTQAVSPEGRQGDSASSRADDFASIVTRVAWVGVVASVLFIIVLALRPPQSMRTVPPFPPSPPPPSTNLSPSPYEAASPEYAALVWAGLAAKRNGDYATAFRELNKACDLQPSGVDAHWVLAWACADRGLRVEAVEQFSIVAELVPGTDTAREAASAIERLGGPGPHTQHDFSQPPSVTTAPDIVPEHDIYTAPPTMFGARERSIHDFMSARWDYYETRDGGYNPESHDPLVHGDAAARFGISPDEAKATYKRVEDYRWGLTQ